MDQTSQVLLDLIKKSLWGTELPDYDSIYDEPVDWDAVFEEAKLQTVAGIVAPVVPDTAPEEIKAKWKNYSYRILANYHKVLSAQDQLLALLKDNNIPVVILKGAAAAVYYPDPSRRNMGDIDFLVPQNLFDSTEELLSNNGYELFQDFSISKRHLGFQKDGIHFELHHHFSHDDAPDIEHYLIEGFNQVETQEIDGHVFTMLPPLANGLVLLDHMRSHLKSGLGLRQVVDWITYVNEVINDSFWETQFSNSTKETGLQKLAITTTKMCVLYLGFERRITWCEKADDKICAELINNLFSYGNFGIKKGVGNSIETVRTSMRHEGVFHRLQESGKHNWKAYHKHHFLKPFCWIYQSFRYIKQGIATKHNAKQFRSSFDEAKKREDLLRQLDI